MVRGSTPTHEITLPDNVDVELIDYVEITYSQEKAAKKIVILRKTKDDYTMDVNVIALKLTQEETFSFFPGDAWIELRILTLGKDVIPLDPIYLHVEDTTSEVVLK